MVNIPIRSAAFEAPTQNLRQICSVSGDLESKLTSSRLRGRARAPNGSSGLTECPEEATVGRPIILTATVKNLSHKGGVSTGEVNFLDGFGNVLGFSIPLRRGKTTLETSALPVGLDTIQVNYIGNLYFARSSSRILVTIGSHRSSTKA
jgi:hypothetical protein